MNGIGGRSHSLTLGRDRSGSGCLKGLRKATEVFDEIT
jgi:hypothetical protein